MKKCVACQKDIPDGAIHCVFCGAKQGGSGLNPMPTPGAAQQKTIMGYAAADLAKLGIPVPGQPAPAPGPPPAAPPAAAAPPPSYAPPPAAAPPPSYAPPPAAPPPAAPAPAEPQRTVMFGGGAPPPSAPPGFGAPSSAPPGFGPSPASAQPTMMAGGAPPPASHPASQPGMQIQSPHVLSQPGVPAAAGVSQQRAAAPPRAQFVPSGDTPVEPWAGTLRLWMILLGLGLIATTVAPWAGGEGKLVFSWSMLSKEGVAQAFKVWPIVFGAGGVLCLLLGLLPVPAAVRGVAGVLLGGAALVLALVVGNLPFGGTSVAGGAGWLGYVALAGSVLAPAGLLAAAQYPRAMLGRIFAFVGGVCLLLPWLLPLGGAGVPLINAIKGLGGGGGLRLANVWVLATTVLGGLLAVIAIIRPLLATFGAWLLILAAPVALVAGTVLDPFFVGGGGSPIDGILAEPIRLLIVIPTLAFPLLLAYGLATLLGKVLEN